MASVRQSVFAAFTKICTQQHLRMKKSTTTTKCLPPLLLLWLWQQQQQQPMARPHTHFPVLLHSLAFYLTAYSKRADHRQGGFNLLKKERRLRRGQTKLRKMRREKKAWSCCFLQFGCCYFKLLFMAPLYNTSKERKKKILLLPLSSVDK